MNLFKVIDMHARFLFKFHQRKNIFGNFFQTDVWHHLYSTLNKKVEVATLILREGQPSIFRVDFTWNSEFYEIRNLKVGLAE